MVTPAIRIQLLNDGPTRPDGAYVLYWMTAFRRGTYNFALQRAVELARELGKPLLILEALQSDYPWASTRLHRFVIEGMRENQRHFSTRGVKYYPYVEPRPGAGRGLVTALARHASALIADDYPCFFLPRIVQAVARRVAVRMEAVDSNGLFPMRATDREFTVAHSFRRFLQKTLPDHFSDFPIADPLREASLPVCDLGSDIVSRWPLLDVQQDPVSLIDSLPIDHSVTRAAFSGGPRTGSDLLDAFLTHRLTAYDEQRNDVEVEATSGLSPYLHFGHVSSHEVFRRLADLESWNPECLADRPNGKRTGWWGMSPHAEAFLDQFVTWRELGFNMCSHREDFDRYESLPGWAIKTLDDHARDPRPFVYTLEHFERAATHDELWNAAQRQLVCEGTIHNYLRMLWGKKILEWSASPREALDVMLQLNNKYALDGRDPNSYSGIFWTLGRYDRAWGPERPIFGKVRYMSSENTARKTRVTGYLARYSAAVLS